MKTDFTEAEAIAYLETQKFKRSVVDRWQANKHVEADLLQGIRKGQTFNEFQMETGAPVFLKDQYIRLQQKTGLAPGYTRKDKKTDQLLQAFKDAYD